MDSFLPLGGFQLPFQKSLSRLYNDTKKSSDFVKEPVQNEEDPEIKGLHRKLRIQKDRFVSWGLEWSESTQKDEIDESLSKAGLSEVVGSIMSTIKDILAEAEPLWLASKRMTEAGRPSPDRKAPLVQWDKGRFEDLVRDLTASVDTLYDLSRTRSMGAVPRRPSKTTYKSSTEDVKAFESTRMQTPQSISPDSLTHIRPKNPDTQSADRQVVFMSKTAYSELPQGTSREPWAPLLLEYATFDSIYSVTGIMPPMSRFEKLSAGLQQNTQRSPGTWTGLPRLLGYFEDMEKSRFGLVYRLPTSFNAVSIENHQSTYSLPTLDNLLGRPECEPRLEAKFRLAHNLSNTIFDMHARGITHGSLAPRNISFCTVSNSSPQRAKGEVDVRRPLVSSFDVFPEDAPEDSSNRHPLDPLSMPTTSSIKGTDERVLELYSLATILLSIGLWTPLESLLTGSSGVTPQSLLDQVALKCGTLYMRAVETCWTAIDRELKGESHGDSLLSAVQTKATRFLEACCILDNMSGLEDRLGEETEDKAQPTVRKSDIAVSIPKESSKEPRDIKSPIGFGTELQQPAALPEPAPWTEVARPDAADSLQEDALNRESDKEKIKLYPNVPLPPEAVEKWNTVLMPQINNALRHFYRKHAESVEISLESVGPAPNRTQPTVLVVCSSVGKVRAILKKRLGDLFDGSTGFSLKVCRGHVLRSRRRSLPVVRSMANRSQVGEAYGKLAAEDNEIEAINPEHQDKPGNGASIGAWIGDRHLPPVSFGGLVLVDDKAYGMTVHHMLDDPDRDFGQEETARSSAIPGRDWYTESYELEAESTVEDEYAYELSDTESEPYSDSDITSDWGDDEDEEEEFEAGDIPGIEPGCGDGYIVTQPALDDVEDGFYPASETEDEDHLDTFSLGEVYASSGIRRKQANGLVHEVDWALFQFNDDRLPEDNYIPHATGISTPRRASLRKNAGLPLLRPTSVAPSSTLPGMEVQCVARTSGLQTGQILPALTSVKIYGRNSPSHTYQIASLPPQQDESSDRKAHIPMGIPGDSGAWVVDRVHGQLCGHILAWSQRKRVAYICPMDVLLLDIAETLEASHVKLPGGDPVVSLEDEDEVDQCGKTMDNLDIEERDEDLFSDSEDEESAPTLVSSLSASSKNISSQSLRSMNDRASPSSMRTASKVELLGRGLNDLRLSPGIGVGV